MIAHNAFGEDSVKLAVAPAKEEATKPAVTEAKAENVHVALNDVAIKKKWEDVVGKLDNMEKQWMAQGRHVLPVVDMKQEGAAETKSDKKKIEAGREARKISEEEDKQKQKAREEVEALKRDTNKAAKE